VPKPKDENQRLNENYQNPRINRIIEKQRLELIRGSRQVMSAIVQVGGRIHQNVVRRNVQSKVIVCDLDAIQPNFEDFFLKNPCCRSVQREGEEIDRSAYTNVSETSKLVFY
jgi:hypothetical protein